MTGPPPQRLTSEEIATLRFAAHRQLARWSNNPRLSPHQRARRDALKRAVHILHDHALSTGCELRGHGHEEHTDA